MAANHPRTVITGASSGIGAAFAARPAAGGYDLTLIARRDRLAGLAARPAQAGPGTVEVHAADLDTAAVGHYHTVARQLLQANGQDLASRYQTTAVPETRC